MSFNTAHNEYIRQQFYHNAWRWKCGLAELPIHPNAPHTTVQRDMSYEALSKTEWSPGFERRMRVRLIFGAYRYGRMGHGGVPPGKPRYDRAASIRKRLTFFERTGNAEWLVDIANLALLMYEEQYHPRFHFRAIDGDTDESYHDKII